MLLHLFKKFESLTNMDFNLRNWKESDLKSLVKYANNWKIAQNLTDKFPHPYNMEDGKTFLNFAMNNKQALMLAIEADSEAIGSIGIFPQEDIHRNNAELGYWLAEPFWGKGIITSAIKKIVELGFNKFDINRIFARPFGSNKASQKALEKAGFQLEAHFKKSLIKDNKFEDELVYAIRK